MSSTQASINKVNALNVDDYIETAKKNNAAKKQADIDAYSTAYDEQIAETQSYYDQKIKEAQAAYTSESERNAVQKLINEKQIAERNANLGLTDSGLNRTQQTAVQMGYSNTKSKIDISRQNALDALNLSLTNAIATLKNEKTAGIRNIENEWDSLSQQQGQEAYRTELSHYNNLIGTDSSTISNGQKYTNNFLLYDWKGETIIDDVGNTLLNFTGSDGKKYKVAAGKNPYTNQTNAKISNVVDGKCIIDSEWQDENKNEKYNPTKRACAQFGVFSNGYQPKGVCVLLNGKMVDVGKVKSTYTYTNVNGKQQTIWYTGNVDEESYQEWIWDGSQNSYRPYIEG